MKFKLILTLVIFFLNITTSFSLTNLNPPLPEAALEAEGKGEWQKAISIYLDLLLKEPKRADLWVRIASIQHNLKKDDAAIMAYQHAIQINPSDPSLYKAISELYAEQKQAKLALANINQAVKLDPQNKDYILAKIQLANWNNDPQAVLDGSQQLYLITHEDNSKGENLKQLSNIAQLQAQLHQDSAAIQTAQQMIALDPDNPLQYKELASQYLNKKDYQNALLAIDKAISFEPKNVSFYLFKIQIASDANNPQLAAETEQKMLSFSSSPKDKETILIHLGGQLSQKGQPDKALAAYNEALQLNPKNANIYRDISQIYASKNDPNSALAAIKKAVELEPQNKEFLKAEANLASWAKDNKLALDVYLQLLELNKQSSGPENAQEKTQILTEIGSLQSQMQLYPDAINTYQELINLNPKQSIYYKKQAEVYVAKKEPQKALEVLHNGIAIDPQNKDLLNDEANLASWSNDKKLALETNLKLLELAKQNPADKQKETTILLTIASLHNQMHQYPEAIKTYQDLIRLNPLQAAYYKGLSEIYASQNDPKNAMEAINKALQLEPANIKYLKAKAEFANWQKNEALALETYQQILKLDPNDKIAKEMVYKATQSPSVAGAATAGTPLQKALATVTNAEAAHQYQLAASLLQRAIALKPNDPTLYKRLAQIYGEANQPKQALLAIDKALALAPTTIEYLRTRGKLASWIGDYQVMADSYQRILRLQPRDEEAIEGYASALIWGGKTDAALKFYRQTLNVNPNNAVIWIKYAEILSWVGDFPNSLKALECYRRLKGETTDYLKQKARVYALAGWYNSSFTINDPLLAKDRKNPYLLITETVAYNKGLQVQKAVDTIGLLNQLIPKDQQFVGLKNVVLTPLRSNLNVEGVYTSASDTTRITNIPVTAQYYLSPVTSLQFLGLYEHARAAKGSGLDTYNGHSTIADESAMLGVNHQFSRWFDLSASAGGLKIQHENEFGIYNVTMNTNLGQTLRVTALSSRNLYRPYLIPQSPRSISLEIMESRRSAFIEWQPFVQKYLNVSVSQSDLSDNNGYWHYNIWPKARVWSSQYWLVTLGVNADLWRYRKRTSDGYYAPREFNGYEGTAEFYYAYSDNVGLSLWGGFGMQKDETFPRYFYEEDLGAQLFLGIFSDWELKAKGGYTLRYNPVSKYDCWSAGMVLTRRF